MIEIFPAAADHFNDGFRSLCPESSDSTGSWVPSLPGAAARPEPAARSLMRSNPAD